VLSLGPSEGNHTKKKVVRKKEGGVNIKTNRGKRGEREGWIHYGSGPRLWKGGGAY